MFKLSKILLASACLLLSSFAMAQTQAPTPTQAQQQTRIFVAGVDYKELPTSYARQSTAAALLQQDGGKVEVLEFFSYYCPGCYALEPAFEVWRQQAATDVVVHRVPVVFRPEWEVVAKAYYTANELGILETVQADLFSAIQQQRQIFTTKGQLADFFTQRGVEPIEFYKIYDGFNVSRYWTQAKLLKLEYQVNIIPAMIVGGRYYTDLGMAKTPTEMIMILDHLIGLSRTNAPPAG